MEIARFGVALDPSGVLEGTSKMKGALDKASADARKVATDLANMKMTPGTDPRVLDGLRGQYAKLTQDAKEYQRAIASQKTNVGNQQIAAVANAAKPQGLAEYEAQVEVVTRSLGEAQRVAADLLQMKPVGSNPALDAQMAQVKALKKELQLLQAAAQSVTPPKITPVPQQASLVSKSEAKSIKQEVASLLQEINKISGSLDKTSSKHLVGPEAIAKDISKIGEADRAVDALIARVGKLNTAGLKGFDIDNMMDDLGRMSMKITEITDKAVKIGGATSPDIAGRMAGAQGTPANVKQMQAELAKASAEAKKLTTALAVMEAQGVQLNPAEAAEFARQLGAAETRTKTLTGGLEAVNGKTQQTKLSAMQLYGFFMGVQQIFAAPLAKAAGLSDKSQEVIDKITGMGMAGFSAGQIISTAFGLGAAGVLAVGGAVVAVVSQLGEARKKAEEVRQAYAQLRGDAQLTGNALGVEQSVASVRELGKALQEVRTQSFFSDAGYSLGVLSGNLGAVEVAARKQMEVMKMGAEDAGKAVDSLVTSTDALVKKEEESVNKKSYAELKAAADKAKIAYEAEKTALQGAKVAAVENTQALRDMDSTILRMTGNMLGINTATFGIQQITSKWTDKLLGLEGGQKKVTKAANEYVAALQELNKEGGKSAEKDPYDELIKKLKQAAELQGLLRGATDSTEDSSALATKVKVYNQLVELKYAERGIDLLSGKDADKVNKIVELNKQADAEERLRKAKEASRKQASSIAEGTKELQTQYYLMDFTGEKLNEMTYKWEEYKKAVKDGNGENKELLQTITDAAKEQARFKDLISYQELTTELTKAVDLSIQTLQLGQSKNDMQGVYLKYLTLINEAEEKGITLTAERKEQLANIARAQQTFTEAQAKSGVLREFSASLLDQSMQVDKLFKSLQMTTGGYQRWQKELDITNRLIAETGGAMGDTMSEFDEYIKTGMEIERQMNRASTKFVQENADLWGELESAGISAIGQLNDAWAAWITGGEFDVEQLFKSVHTNVTKITAEFLQAQVLGAKMNRNPDGLAALGQQAKRLSGKAGEAADTTQVMAAATLTAAKAGGFATAAATSAAAAASSAAAAAALVAGNAAAKIGGGAVEAGLDIIPEIQHGGGYTGQGASRRSVPASSFRGAGRFKAGGFVNGEIPIIAHENEAVVPLANGRRIPVKLSGESGGGGTTIVQNHFHFPPGTDARSFLQSRSQIESVFSNMVRKNRTGR